MTNIQNSFYPAMTAPGLPERNTINKKIIIQLIHNPYGLAFFMNIACRLKQDRSSFINTISVDVSFVKNEYTKPSYSKHIAYLVKCGLIIKTGSKNSWTYLVNPKAFHCLTREHRDIDWPMHYQMFPEIIIDQP